MLRTGVIAMGTAGLLFFTAGPAIAGGGAAGDNDVRKNPDVRVYYMLDGAGIPAYDATSGKLPNYMSYGVQTAGVQGSEVGYGAYGYYGDSASGIYLPGRGFSGKGS